MVKKIGLYNFKNKNEIEKHFSKNDIEIFELDNIEHLEDFDLVITKNCIENIKGNIINVHPSLLPAYPSQDAPLKAFQDGVKVSGITIHTKDKIIAQYPILIGIDTHIDDFLSEITQLENKLLPHVINAIIEDRVFDFHDLFSHKCSKNGGCSGCGSCH